MITNFIIAWRETLEIGLIISIVFSYLKKTGQKQYLRTVWLAIGLGIVVCVAAGILLYNLTTGFSGRAEKIFEGITMLVAAVLITSMIVWLLRQKNIAKKLELSLEKTINSKRSWELFLLVFFSILREGIEMVILLQAATLVDSKNNLSGILLGAALSLVLCLSIYYFSLKLNLKKFFLYTSIFLILFAGGLVAHGLHELNEANILPPLIQEIWDINPVVNLDGSFPWWHEKGTIGSLLTGLFGYNGNPSLLEVIGYVTYIVFTYFIWKRYSHPLNPPVAFTQKKQLSPD